MNLKTRLTARGVRISGPAGAGAGRDVAVRVRSAGAVDAGAVDGHGGEEGTAHRC